MSTRTGLSKYAAEGVAIVISILVAFAIDASWENRQDSSEEHRMLSALVSELEAKQGHLQERTAFHEEIQTAILDLMSEASADPPALSVDSLDTLLGKASWFNNLSTFEMSASDAIVLGGRLSVIEEEPLRQRITAWNRDVERVVQTERQDYDTFSDVWMPYLREHGDLPQVSNAIQLQPGSGEANYGPAAPAEGEQVDHHVLFTSQEFHNVLLHRLWVQNDILFEYDRLTPRLESLIDMIHGVIGPRPAAG